MEEWFDKFIELFVDPKSVPEIYHDGTRAVLKMKECSCCAALYNPQIGHDCERIKPRDKDSIIKGLFCCVTSTCSECPYSDGPHGRRRLLNYDFVKYGCKELLEKHAKQLFSDHKEEVQDGHEDKNASPHT